MTKRGKLAGRGFTVNKLPQYFQFYTYAGSMSELKWLDLSENKHRLNVKNNSLRFWIFFSTQKYIFHKHYILWSQLLINYMSVQVMPVNAGGAVNVGPPCQCGHHLAVCAPFINVNNTCQCASQDTISQWIQSVTVGTACQFGDCRLNKYETCQCREWLPARTLPVNAVTACYLTTRRLPVIEDTKHICGHYW